MKHFPGLVSWFYEPAGGESFGIGWIFVANLISSLIVMACLLPEIRKTDSASKADSSARCWHTAGRCSFWESPE